VNAKRRKRNIHSVLPRCIIIELLVVCICLLMSHTQLGLFVYRVNATQTSLGVSLDCQPRPQPPDPYLVLGRGSSQFRRWRFAQEYGVQWFLRPGVRTGGVTGEELRRRRELRSWQLVNLGVVGGGYAVRIRKVTAGGCLVPVSFAGVLVIAGIWIRELMGWW
jgi:hypothetical protein